MKMSASSDVEKNDDLVGKGQDLFFNWTLNTHTINFLHSLDWVWKNWPLMSHAKSKSLGKMSIILPLFNAKKDELPWKWSQNLMYEWQILYMKWLKNKTENFSVYKHSKKWLIFNFILTEFWLYFGCILTVYWMYFSCILTVFWPYIGCILAAFWLNFCCILTAFWLKLHWISKPSKNVSRMTQIKWF